MRFYSKLKFFFFLVSAALLSSCAHMPSQSTSLPPIAMVSPPNTSNKTALRIYEKLPVYANAAKIPWQPLSIKKPLKVGSHDPAITDIETRLIALRNLNPIYASKENVYTSLLANAVSEFQYENSLPRTGVVDQATLNALNITPTQRFHELVVSMNEWAQYPDDANSRYVQVNIPSYSMRLMHNGQNILEMKVIVGRPSRPTPTLTSRITTIVFNPSWNVPKTILGQDVIPGMRENRNYMKEHYDMRVYANWNKDAPEISASSIDWQTATVQNFKYRVTAPPSDKNPLGRVKFIFANEHDVYMHDTPEKAVFGLSDRDRSSGCIRLEDPMALVRYFYLDNDDLNDELVQQYLSSNETKYIQLRNEMPVYITYILSAVDSDGHVHFWKNIYNK